MWSKERFDNLLPLSITKSTWIPIIGFFLLGLAFRSLVFFEPHGETDELIYSVLVEQLNNGKGYTLLGHPLLEAGVIDKTLYAHPVFFHPPGGIFLFWLFDHFFGHYGYPLVQILSFTLFFWCMIFISALLTESPQRYFLIIVAALSAFNPVVAHVTRHFWLDGPLLAFSTLSVYLFLLSVTRCSWKWACIAGIFIGFAGLIKLTAFLVLPGAIFLAWALKKEAKREFFLIALIFIITAFLVQLPWELWLWVKIGTPFYPFPGKPPLSLIETSEYIYYITVTRSPWTYLTLTPRVLWTFTPTLFLWPALWSNKPLLRTGAAFLLWISAILATHIALGYGGYSKLLRYIILITPALILWFSLSIADVLNRHRAKRYLFNSRITSYCIAIVSIAALVLEIIQGTFVSINSNIDLINPISVADILEYLKDLIL